MTKTTEEQVKKIQALVFELSVNENVDRAEINDWGRFGNFDVHVYPKMEKTSVGTYRLSNKKRFVSIKKQLKIIIKKYDGVILREIHEPDRKDIYDPNLSKNIGGCVRNYLSIDLDYQEYNSETNTFK